MVSVFFSAVACLVVLLSGMREVNAMPPVRVTGDQGVPACVTPDRLMAFLQSRNPRHNQRYDDIAEIYAAEGRRLGVRWDFAFFHMLHETGDLTFRRSPTEPGPVAPEQNNFAGLGAAGDGLPGESFPDIYTGVRAHLEHLLVYAGVNIPAPVSRRTYDVQRWGVLDAWLKGLPGPVTFSDLTWRWGMGQESYIRAISRIARSFYATYCDGKEMIAATLVRPPQLARAPHQSPSEVASAEAPPDASRPPRAFHGSIVAKTSVAGLEANEWSGARRPEKTAQTQALPLNPQHSDRPYDAPSVAIGEPPTVGNIRERAGSQRKPQALAARHRPDLSNTLAGQRRDKSPKPEAEEDPLHKLVSGNVVHITNSMGVTLPVKFLENGEIIGRANGYGFYLGAEQDRGKWWIESSMVCTRWRIWLERQTKCIKVVRQRGNQFYWRSVDGSTGTARIVGS